MDERPPFRQTLHRLLHPHPDHLHLLPDHIHQAAEESFQQRDVLGSNHTLQETEQGRVEIIVETFGH